MMMKRNTYNPVEGIEVLEVLEIFEESNKYETKDPELVVPVEMEVKVGLRDSNYL